ncbi:MAG: hypothetical protein ACTHJT_11770 [Cytophaga sp.]|uniref:hypothetical protein n=1 Tax=Cytophaga sp. TaxID=29535 RepID=UPI003F8078B4
MNKKKLLIFSVVTLVLIVFLEFLFILKWWFSYFPHIGIFFHITGGIAFSAGVFAWFYGDLSDIKKIIQFIFVSGSAAIAAIGWECVEWILGAVRNRRFQGIGVDNTMEDLFLSMAGGVIFGLFLMLQKKNNSKILTVKSILPEQILVICSSFLILAGIVFLEFYFLEEQLFEQYPDIGIGFHFLGGFFVTVVTYYMFIKNLSELKWFLLILFLTGTVALAAVGWEGFEWTLGRLTGKFYQVSIDNTMLDLVTGLAGGIIAWPFVLLRNFFFCKR